MRRLFQFPDPVDETSARLVAAGVVVQAVAFLVLREGWILIPLVYGFAARAATGPTLSPLGQFVTRVVTPRIGGEHRYVAGPPKRFAQAVGLVFSATAGIAWWVDAHTLADAVIAMLIVAATLESVFAVCLGCIVYRFFWDCADCNDITDRLRTALGVPATN